MSTRGRSSSEPSPRHKRDLMVRIPADWLPDCAARAEASHKSVVEWVRDLMRYELFHHEGVKPIKLVLSKEVYEQFAMVAQEDTRDVSNMAEHLVRGACAASAAKRAGRI